MWVITRSACTPAPLVDLMLRFIYNDAHLSFRMPGGRTMNQNDFIGPWSEDKLQSSRRGKEEKDSKSLWPSGG